jgi:hypothetical protein
MDDTDPSFSLIFLNLEEKGYLRLEKAIGKTPPVGYGLYKIMRGAR